jgi:signal transduction histidine kinase
VAVAAVLLAGCGDETRELTKAEYEREVRSVYRDVQAAFQATRVDSPAELADRVRAAQDELRAAADELDAIEPPEEVAGANDRLVAGMRAYADELDTLHEAAEEEDAEAIEEFNRRLASNEAIEEMAEAAEQMKFKGYDLGPIAEE